MTHPIHSGYIIGGVLACSCPCEHPALASALFTSSRHQRSPSCSLHASATRVVNVGRRIVSCIQAAYASHASRSLSRITVERCAPATSTTRHHFPSDSIATISRARARSPSGVRSGMAYLPPCHSWWLQRVGHRLVVLPRTSRRSPGRRCRASDARCLMPEGTRHTRSKGYGQSCLLLRSDH